MDLKDYFDPVELDKPDVYTNLGDKVFYKNIFTHSQNNPVSNININGYNLAIVGIKEDRNSVVKGSAMAPDIIRNKLYQLAAIDKIKIIDLGNIKQGNTINDSYAGIKDVCSYLLNNNINILLLGGSNDLVFPVITNHFWKSKQVELTCIDARINFDNKSTDINSENYLNRIIEEKENSGFFLNNIGHQMYLNNTENIEILNNNLFNICRLGEVRKSPVRFEPLIRNSDIVTLDICSIKQSEAQGQYNPSPNGFTGDETCQIALFAGMSEKTKVFGIFDVFPDFDINEQTTGLSAQLAWHYIFGVAGCQGEDPEKSQHFKKFIIGMETRNTFITFYKSEVTERWWLEVVKNDKNQTKLFIPCTLDDYEKACRHEIPDIWWKASQRYNIENK